ncbi:MAG: alpha/beta hydrolase [Acidimicrobiia bacterium]|nr:alpha/beta hydrolase [Acidimicrobiia bacterium]
MTTIDRAPAMPVRLAGWKTRHGRADYLRAYDAALDLWSAPYDLRTVPTRFGPTRAVVSGDEDAPPLLLLPAASGIGALQWYPNVAALGVQHHVFALDFVGGPGGGTQTRAMIDRHDYAAWLVDILDDLAIEGAAFVGSSQGGWIVLNLCVMNPERVTSAALLAPAASLLPFSWQTEVSLRLHPPGWTARPALRAILGPDVEIDDRLVDVMAAGLKHFRYQQRSVFPDVFGETALNRVDAPLLIVIGDREIIYEPRAALARAAASIPHARTELVRDAGHLLNLQMPDLVDQMITSFFASPTDRA